MATVPCVDCAAPLDRLGKNPPRRCVDCRRVYRRHKDRENYDPGRQRARDADRFRVPCASCGGPTWLGRGSLGEGLSRCLGCKRAATPVRPCERCGAAFKVRNQGRRFCSFECAMAVRRGVEYDPAKHNGKRNSPGYRGARRQVLAEESHCWLCGDEIDKALRHPHLMSGTADHVVPVALGGDDERSNLRAAHFVCNIRRGVALRGAARGLVGPEGTAGLSDRVG